MYAIARRLAAIIHGTFFIAFTLQAAPMISVDSANFDLGTVREGEKKSIKHTFTIKNSGTDTLRIEKVKPG